MLCSRHLRGVVSSAVRRAASATTHGVLVHGTRRILPGSTGLFRDDFDAWTTSSGAGSELHAAFAFPDPADQELLHSVFWSKGDMAEAGPLKSEAFASTAEDPDTFNAYGTGKVESVGVDVQLHRHEPLAGFIRAEHPGAVGPPMIGIFRRSIKPGRLENLASSFQIVCDIWYRTVPGILAATVSRDPVEDNVVHDIRVFADKASYAAHVDKSNATLTEAMEVWFDNYDTAIPHQGALFTEGTSDPSLRTSSIKGKPIKVAFNHFHYGQNMIGELPTLK